MLHCNNGRISTQNRPTCVIRILFDRHVTERPFVSCSDFYVDYHSWISGRDFKRLDLWYASELLLALHFYFSLCCQPLTCDSQFIACRPSKHNCQGFIKRKGGSDTFSPGEPRTHLQVFHKQEKVYEKLAKHNDTKLTRRLKGKI